MVLEYYRDGTGLSSLESTRLCDYVDFNAEQNRLQAADNLSVITLPAGNLLRTLQGLGQLSRGQNYAFARLSRDRLARRWDIENIRQRLAALYNGDQSFSILRAGGRTVIRIHRSTIVNVGQVKEIVSWFGGRYICRLKNCAKDLPVSRSMVKNLRDAFGF